MVMSFFFRRGGSGLEQITNRVVAMLGDARHTFDLASSAVLGGVPFQQVAEAIHTTDERINRAEQDLRRELIVHVTVQGADDIGYVLGYTLLIKKIERIGDQAKNIFDLAVEGATLAGADDVDEFVQVHSAISAMMGEVAELMLDPDAARIADFRRRADEMRQAEEHQIRDLMHSEQPGSWAVPRAVLHRYLKRIIANLAGVVATITEPVLRPDDDDID